MSATGIYKGYTFADVSTPTENGRYRARVAILALDGERTRSQRFIDLEVFKTRQEAGERGTTIPAGPRAASSPGMNSLSATWRSSE